MTAGFSLQAELALRVSTLHTLTQQAQWGEVQWWPALGLGDASGPQAWVRPRPVLVGWGYGCVLDSDESPDVRATMLTSVSARVPLLAPQGSDGVTHAYLNLKSPIRWWRADAVLGRVVILNDT